MKLSVEGIIYNIFLSIEMWGFIIVKLVVRQVINRILDTKWIGFAQVLTMMTFCLQ